MYRVVLVARSRGRRNSAAAAMGPANSASALFSGWLVWFAAGVGAEIFKLERTRVPDRYSLLGYHMFRMYAPEDSPGPYKGMPGLALEDIRVHWTQKPGQWPYEGLEVALIPFDKFWSLVHADRLCAEQRLLLAPNGSSMKDLGVAVAPLEDRSKLDMTVKRSGTWILVLSNCGNSSGAEVSGRISLSHPYGLLPALDYWTFQVYGVLSVVYGIITVLWLVALWRNSAFHYDVHHCLLVVAVFAFLECYCAYFMYRWWNITGIQNASLAIGKLTFNCLKYVFSLRLLLVFGVHLDGYSGSSSDKGDHPRSVQYYCAAVVFLVQQCMTKLVLQSQHGLSLDPKTLLTISILGCLVCFVIFAWVFQKYANMDDWVNRAGKDSSVVQLFIATRRVLLLTFGLATGVVMVQFFDIIWDSAPWELQWIPHDGSPSLAFLIFITLIIKVWWPNTDLWKLAYTQTVATQEVNGEIRHNGPVVHHEIDGPDMDPAIAEKVEDREEVLTNSLSTKSKRVKPEIVGVSSRHDEQEGGELL